MIDPNHLGVIDADLSDRESAELWTASGAQWLTDPDVGVPVALVRRVLGLVEALDAHGARLHETVPADGLGLLAERAALMGLPPAGRISAGGASELLAATDGWIALSLARDDDITLVPAWLELDAIDLADPWPTVRRAVAEHDCAGLIDRAGLLGLPCAAVGEVDDPQPVIAHRLGDAPGRPLDGAVVVNLAALWAGPLAADLLARLGARVITVESTTRPDGGRLARRFFNLLHGHTESVALDLTAAGGHDTLRRLLERADVVIEGSRPRALQHMGIDATELVRTGPSVWLSITAQGREPGDRVGFGDDAAAGGGLVGWTSGEPRFLADAIADPLAGLTAAVTAAALLSNGGRWLADLALSRVANAPTGPFAEPTSATPLRPRPRSDPGKPMPLGRDTEDVLRSLGVD